MSIVHIEDKAFMTVLLAAVEAFPSKYRPNMKRKPKGIRREGEVHGLLFGQRMNKTNGSIYNVTLAIPNQIIVDCDEASITPSNHHIERIRELTELFPSYQLLGFFHSHPYKRTEFHKKISVDFSESDEKSALHGARDIGNNLLEVIFGITCLERRSWTKSEFIGQHLIHNCCGTYKYSIACYEAISENDRLDNVKNLICPVASGMHYVDFT